MGLLAPVFLLVLAFTAVPLELRPFDVDVVQRGADLRDLAANVVAYLPVGLVLARFRWWWALLLAAGLTGTAELSQFVMEHRFPSLTDVASNLAGGAVGWGLARLFGLRDAALPLRRPVAASALLLLLATLALGARWERATGIEAAFPSELEVNPRGATAEGTLEASWDFDPGPTATAEAPPYPGPGLLRGDAHLVEGVRGGAVRLDGSGDNVDFGSPIGLRLMGSLTLSAWIHPTSYPGDDATIVSSHVPGYQLDATVDEGPRTIGLKLVDACGNIMARYGRTELTEGAWQHVAGVYDADDRTMRVYLNGQSDDGVLDGPVTPYQQGSAERLLVGMRPDPAGFEFAGLIDEVRVYSRALTPEEVATVAAGGRVEGAASDGAASESATFERIASAAAVSDSVGVQPTTAGAVRAARLEGTERGCDPAAAAAYVFVPGLAVTLGILAALGWFGLTAWRGLSVLVPGAAAGAALASLLWLSLPRDVLYGLPLLAMAGAGVVLLSVRGAPPDEPTFS